jgi:hypothetical protein
MKFLKPTFLRYSALALIGVLSANPAQALMSLGVKGGINLSSVAATNSAGNSVSSYSTQGMGYEGGLGVDIGLGPIGVLVDVLYTKRTVGFGTGTIPALTGSDLSFNSLLVPVQARFAIIPLLSLTGGLYYSMILGDGTLTTSSGTESTVTFSDNAKSDFGLVGGVGVSLPLGVTTLTLEARYLYGLKNTADAPTGDESSKHRVIDVLAGVTF